MKNKLFHVSLTVVLLATLLYVSGSSPVQADSHVARIVVNQALTGQTTDLSPAATLTSLSGGANYRVSVYPEITAGASAGSITIDFTDATGAQQRSFGLNQSGGNLPQTYFVHSASSTTLSVSTISTQTSGGCTYNLYVVIEEI